MVESARKKKDPGYEAFLTAQLHDTDNEVPQSPVTVLPATGDRTIPIFDLQLGHLGQGVWVNDIEAHLLLDLRMPQPKLAADLSCNSITAFGVCGVWNAQMQDRNDYE